MPHTPGNLQFDQAENYDATYGGVEVNVAELLAVFGMAVFPTNEIGLESIQTLPEYGVLTEHKLKIGVRPGTFFLETGDSL